MSTTEDKRITAAGYARVSTARQASEGLSLDEQRREIEQRCEREGWTLAEIYIDRGVSGRKADRPALDRLLADLDGVDRVVVSSLDRLGRSAADTLRLFQRFDQAGAALVAIRQEINTATSTGRLVRDLLAVLAQWESEQIADRVRAGNAARFAQGGHHGKPPFGYRTRNRRLEIVPAEAEIIRRIFREAGDGRSQRQIAAGLNRDGIKSRRGGRWPQPSIGRILVNSTYRGAVEFNGERVEGAHEAIISEADWRRAEAVRTAGPRRHSKGGPGRLPVGLHLFTRGLLRCGACGGPMSPHTGDSQLYACRNVECPTTSVRRVEIDAAAWSYFERVGLDVDATEAAARAAVEAARAEARAASERAAQQQRKAAADLDRVRGDYTSGEITAAEWRELREPLERAAAEAAADAAKAADLAERAEAGEAAAEGFTEHVSAQLAELRRAISGEIATAEGLDAARAALVRLFDRFEIYAAERGDLPADQAAAAEAVRAKLAATDQTVEAAGWIIVPHPRAEAIAGHDLTPLLRRTTLGIKDNDGVQMLSSAYPPANRPRRFPRRTRRP